MESGAIASVMGLHMMGVMLDTVRSEKSYHVITAVKVESMILSQ